MQVQSTMKNEHYKDLKFLTDAKKRQKSAVLISSSSDYDFICRNCGNLLHQEVIQDFVDLMPDDKVSCPLCMSLDIQEVSN